MTIKAINVRNQFKGSIKEIVLGDVLSEIDVQTASGIVTSVITTRSVKELELVVGSEVIAFVKSTEVSIAKLYAGEQKTTPEGVSPSGFFVHVLNSAVWPSSERRPEPAHSHIWNAFPCGSGLAREEAGATNKTLRPEYCAWANTAANITPHKHQTPASLPRPCAA